MNILSILPIELKRKVISYMERPPHYYAIKNAPFPIRDSLLFMNMSPEIIRLNFDLLDDEWAEYFESISDD